MDLQGGKEYFELAKEKLQPNAFYVVEVRAQFCPDEILQGPWSEWSSGAEWSTASPVVNGGNFYIFLFEQCVL